MNGKFNLLWWAETIPKFYMKKDKRVRASLSQSQWKKVETEILQASNKNVRQYIISQLLIIDQACRNLPDIDECTDCQQEKKFSLTPAAHAAIERIKRKTGVKDSSTIISKFVLPKLLINSKN